MNFSFYSFFRFELQVCLLDGSPHFSETAILVHLGLSLPPEAPELFGDPEILHDLATFGSNYPGNAVHHGESSFITEASTVQVYVQPWWRRSTS